MVWMIHIDGKERNGWRNLWLDHGDIIREEHIGGNKMPHESNRDRIVFEIDDTSTSRKYIFCGLYHYLQNESEPNNFRIYAKIKDSYNEEK